MSGQDRLLPTEKVDLLNGGSGGLDPDDFETTSDTDEESQMQGSTQASAPSRTASERGESQRSGHASGVSGTERSQVSLRAALLHARRLM